MRHLPLLLVLSCSLPSLAQEEVTPPPVVAVAARALGIELEFVAPGRLPASDLQQKIVLATDGAPDCLAGSQLLVVRYRWPGSSWQAATMAIVPVRPPARDKPWSVVLVAGDDGQMAGGAVLDAEGAVAEAWRGFGEEFAGKSLPALTGAVKTSELRARLAALAKAQDKEGKAALALASLRTEMLRQSGQVPAVMQALGAGRAIPPAAAKKVEDAFAAMAALAGDLEPFFGKGTSAYAEQAKAAAAQIAALRDWQPDKKTGAERLRALRRSCAACHELTSESFAPDLASFCGDKRQALGLGDRPFEPGHDVLWAGTDAAALPVGEGLRLLAAGFRRAALLLAAQRGR